jgi:hypothetical protein
MNFLAISFLRSTIDHLNQRLKLFTLFTILREDVRSEITALLNAKAIIEACISQLEKESQ